MASVLKTEDSKGSVSSNLTASAKNKRTNMNSKDTIEKAFANVTKDVSNPNLFDWIQPGRSLKYYYLTLIRFFTR